MNVDFKIFLMYTITIYACSVEGIYVEYGFRDKDESTILHHG